MKLENTFFSSEYRSWLGLELDSGAHFIAIPVANRFVGYIEAFKITDLEYEVFLGDVEARPTSPSPAGAENMTTQSC